MLVYQALLLAGYAWAFWLPRLPVRRQVIVHLGLLGCACLWLPIGLASMEPPTGNSVVLFVPLLLLVSVGPVILVVSAQAPLVQQLVRRRARRQPLPPVRGLQPRQLRRAPRLPAGRRAPAAARHPALTLDHRLRVLLVPGRRAGRAHRPARRGRTAPAGRGAADERRADRPGAGWLTWIVLSAVPSGLMLSTTTHLSTDIMAMPLLWAIPLGLYLLSFTVAFADRRGPARVDHPGRAGAAHAVRRDARC